jgi:hypothetical protein
MEEKVVTVKGKKKVVKCRGIDIHGNPCRANDKENGFCQNHDYMKDYTDEMMANLTPCSGCKRQMYLPNGGTCDDDKKRAKEIREKKKQTNVKCKKNNCDFKSKGNGYCGKHHLQAWKDEVEKSGKKVCVNYIRACRNILEPDSENSRCQKCRGDANEAGKHNKIKIIEQNENNNGILCTGCLDSFPDEHFIGDKGQITKTCRHCRELNKIADLKRSGRIRNSESMENNPERAIKKVEWRKNNYDKVKLYWQKARKLKIDTLGMDEYLKRNAEYAKKYRAEHEEFMKKLYAKQKIDPVYKFNCYRYRANKKSIEFNLSQDECEKLFTSDCYYCGIEIDELSLNGIDRINSDDGYKIDNCVSCCKICNFMKGCYDVDVFIGICSHILTYNKLVDGKLNYKLFSNINGTSYNTYLYRATKKGMKFELTNADYIALVNGICYLCGKESNINHLNGIDRYDNIDGYNIKNCRSCCATCNYMKRDNTYDHFINKLKDIYENHKEFIILGEIDEIAKEIENIVIASDECKSVTIDKKDYSAKLRQEMGDEAYKAKKKTDMAEYRAKKKITVKADKVKLTPEQIKENARLRKQKQRELLKQKVGEDEYKNILKQNMQAYRSKATEKEEAIN